MTQCLIFEHQGLRFGVNLRSLIRVAALPRALVEAHRTGVRPDFVYLAEGPFYLCTISDRPLVVDSDLLVGARLLLVEQSPNKAYFVDYVVGVDSVRPSGTDSILADSTGTAVSLWEPQSAQGEGEEACQ